MACNLGNYQFGDQGTLLSLLLVYTDHYNLFAY